MVSFIDMKKNEQKVTSRSRIQDTHSSFIEVRLENANGMGPSKEFP